MEESNNKKRIVAVVGPTASGKTALGVKLAKVLQSEVISADSMQIYTGMDIASAKPTLSEMEGIPHHLVNFKNPTETFSVAEYTALAHAEASRMHENHQIPIVVGGTGLYVDSFLQNLQFDSPPVNEEYKKYLETRADHGEGGELLEELKKVDPVLGEKLHVKDQTRIIRGLTVYKATQKPLSLWQEEARQVPSPYEVIWFGLTTEDRAALYNRINLRVDLMMEQGLLEEAHETWEQSTGKTASAAIGHKEFFPYFEGEISLEEAVEKLKRNTRRYAKRQLTWFRKNEMIQWFYIDKNTPDEIFCSMMSKINQ